MFCHVGLVDSNCNRLVRAVITVKDSAGNTNAGTITTQLRTAAGLLLLLLLLGYRGGHNRKNQQD